MKIFSLLSVFFLSIALFASCRKEFSFESHGDIPQLPIPPPPPPPNTTEAVFTLVGAPDNCMAARVNGTYQTTVALTSSNSVELLVDVTTAGSYAITTNTANGISFSAIGEFTSLGQQSVVLGGNGTPSIEETTVLTPAITGSSCSFSVDIQAAPPVNTGVFTCKINNVFTDFSTDASELSVLEPYTDPFSLLVKGNGGPYFTSNSSSFQILINKNNQSPGTVFTPGTYNENGFRGINGYTISIIYSEAVSNSSNILWRTSSNLTPFTIIVTEISPHIKGTFFGTLTDISGTTPGSKIITDGIFDLPNNH